VAATQQQQEQSRRQKRKNNKNMNHFSLEYICGWLRTFSRVFLIYLRVIAYFCIFTLHTAHPTAV
jgi:hypothetical protein